MSARIDWGYDAARLGAISMTLAEAGTALGTVTLSGQYMHEHALDAVQSLDPITSEYVTTDLGYRTLSSELKAALEALGAGTYTVSYSSTTRRYSIACSGVASFALTALSTGASRMLGEPASTDALTAASTVDVWHASYAEVGAWSDWQHRDGDAQGESLIGADGSVRGLAGIGTVSLLDLTAPWEPREAVRSDESGYTPRGWTWQRAIKRCGPVEPCVIVSADDVQRHVAYLRHDQSLKPRLAARDYLAHQSIGLGFHVIGEWLEPVAPAIEYLLDAIGVTPWGAWSTRLLSSAYTGQCMRVRRASDNAESDFGFAPISGGQRFLDTAAIVSWLAGSAGYVHTWYDQSGSGRDVSNAAPTNQPRIVAAGGVVDTKNGKPSLYRSGDIVRLTTATQAHGASSFESFAVASIDGGSYARVVSIRSTSAGVDYDNAGSCAAILRDASTSAIVAYRQAPLASRAITIGTLTSMSSRFGASNAMAVGVAGAETSGTYATAALASSVTLSLMCDAAQTGAMQGYLSEAIHWSSALTAGQRSDVHASHVAAWGVA